MHVLADFQENTGQPGILADWNIVCIGNLEIFFDFAQYGLSAREWFAAAAGCDGFLHIARQVAVGINTQVADHFRNFCCLDFSHFLFLH